MSAPVKPTFKSTRLKSYGFKASLEGENTISGSPAVMGNVDRGGDVIFPGAFSKTPTLLSDFLKRGSVPVGHDWYGLPVAYPVSAKEQGSQLISEAKFHSTQAAQDARTVCKERIEAGLEVGLSIGFSLDYYNGNLILFEDGGELLEYADQLGYDMSLFDTAGIKAWDDWCWGIVAIEELFEWSIVTVPMNASAIASDVKSFLKDKSPAGLSLSDHLKAALAAVEGATERMEEYVAMRKGEKRPVNPDRMNQVKTLADALSALLAVDAPDTSREAKANELIARSLALRSRQTASRHSC